MRRAALLAGLLCVTGAFLVLVGAGRTWVTASTATGALLPSVDVLVSGNDLRPGLAALGLVGLAGVPALAATRGRGRIPVGAVLVVTGLAVVVLVVQLLGSEPGLVTTALMSEQVQQAAGGRGVAGAATFWPFVTSIGGVLVAAAGALVAARGSGWVALDRRYDAPAADPGSPPPRPAARPDQREAGTPAERELWEALDRGEDPTGARPAPPDPPSSGTTARD